MILVPAKDVHALEARVAYLEETVAALTESWQHIDTHRLCVSDDSGAQTCITKAQLDVFLSQQAKISEPTLAQEAKLAPPAEATEAAEVVAAAPPAAEPAAEPATVVSENALPQPEPEITGTVASAAASEGDAVAPAPKLEVFEEPAAKSED
jgi:biotin carboxyl carrier protein